MSEPPVRKYANHEEVTLLVKLGGQDEQTIVAPETEGVPANPMFSVSADPQNPSVLELSSTGMSRTLDLYQSSRGTIKIYKWKDSGESEYPDANTIQPAIPEIISELQVEFTLENSQWVIVTIDIC